MTLRQRRAPAVDDFTSAIHREYQGYCGTPDRPNRCRPEVSQELMSAGALLRLRCDRRDAEQYNTA